MPVENRELYLSADELALMGQLGIAEAQIHEILATGGAPRNLRRRPCAPIQVAFQPRNWTS